MKESLAVLAVAGTLALTGTACSGGSEAPKEADGTGTTARPPGTASAQLTTAEYRVHGMTCAGCAIATEMAVEKVDGVESVDAEYLGDGKGGRCTVTFDPSVADTDRIAAAIEEAGFEPALTRTSGGS